MPSGFCQRNYMFFLLSLFSLLLSNSVRSQQQPLKIKLKKKSLSEIAMNIDQPQMVYSLDLSANNLEVLDSSICRFTNLSELNLSRNRLKELPECFSKLPIIDLDLSKNKLETVPQEVETMLKLETLDLWGNQFYFLSHLQFNQPNLKQVDLRMNALPNEVQQSLQAKLPKIKFDFTRYCDCY